MHLAPVEVSDSHPHAPLSLNVTITVTLWPNSRHAQVDIRHEDVTHSDFSDATALFIAMVNYPYPDTSTNKNSGIQLHNHTRLIVAVSGVLERA